METFAEFFKYGEPAMGLPELEVKMPVGALALAVTAVIFISSKFNFLFKFCSFIRSSVLLFYIETTISNTRMTRFT
jgi:hypothetical protein